MSGAFLLALISVVVVIDYILAMYFIARANRARQEIGTPRPLDSEGEVDNPETLRRVAHILMLAAPLIWLVAAAFSFGLVPVDAIIPIKF